MENNENKVTEQVTEAVEQTTPPKTYTQDEVNEMMGKRIARNTAKIQKENDRKYGKLMEVLQAGTGKNSVEEVTDTLEKFYQRKGVPMPKQPNYTEQDIEVLARADADEIIRSGYEDVVEEVDRLSAVGVERMTAREKAVFKALAQHRQSAERGQELSALGVTEDVYNSKDFTDFASKFNPNTSIRDIYDIYTKTQPKKNYQTMGSMKHTASADSGVKEFYTPEEARKFTKKDYDNNPALFAAVERSMQQWK